MAQRGERLRVPRAAWPHILVAALLLNAIPFTLFAYGERHVSSVVAGLWNASAPLWVLLVVMLALSASIQRPHAQRGSGAGSRASCSCSGRGYLVPVFSTVLGAVVLSEAVHWNQPVGAAVLLVGIAVSQGRWTARASPTRAR